MNLKPPTKKKERFSITIFIWKKELNLLKNLEDRGEISGKEKKIYIHQALMPIGL